MDNPVRSAELIAGYEIHTMSLNDVYVTLIGKPDEKEHGKLSNMASIGPHFGKELHESHVKQVLKQKYNICN